MGRIDWLHRTDISPEDWKDRVDTWRAMARPLHLAERVFDQWLEAKERFLSEAGVDAEFCVFHDEEYCQLDSLFFTTHEFHQLNRQGVNLPIRNELHAVWYAYYDPYLPTDYARILAAEKVGKKVVELRVELGLSEYPQHSQSEKF